MQGQRFWPNSQVQSTSWQLNSFVFWPPSVPYQKILPLGRHLKYQRNIVCSKTVKNMYKTHSVHQIHHAPRLWSFASSNIHVASPCATASRLRVSIEIAKRHQSLMSTHGKFDDEQLDRRWIECRGACLRKPTSLPRCTIAKTNAYGTCESSRRNKTNELTHSPRSETPSPPVLSPSSSGPVPSEPVPRSRLNRQEMTSPSNRTSPSPFLQTLPPYLHRRRSRSRGRFQRAPPSRLASRTNPPPSAAPPRSSNSTTHCRASRSERNSASFLPQAPAAETAESAAEEPDAEAPPSARRIAWRRCSDSGSLLRLSAGWTCRRRNRGYRREEDLRGLDSEATKPFRLLAWTSAGYRSFHVQKIESPWPEWRRRLRRKPTYAAVFWVVDGFGCASQPGRFAITVPWSRRFACFNRRRIHLLRTKKKKKELKIRVKRRELHGGFLWDWNWEFFVFFHLDFEFWNTVIHFASVEFKNKKKI